MLNPFKSKAVYSSDLEEAMSSLEQVTDEKTLRKIAAHDSDPKHRALLPVRAAAALRLNDLALFAETVCREDEIPVFGPYIFTLQNVKLLTLLTNRLNEGTGFNKKERKLEIVGSQIASLQYQERQTQNQAAYAKRMAEEKIKREQKLEAEKRRREQKQAQLVASLKTDEERLACIKANILNEPLIRKILPEIQDRACLLDLLGNRRIRWSVLEKDILKRLGYSDIAAVDDRDCMKQLLRRGSLDSAAEKDLLNRGKFSDKELFLLGYNLSVTTEGAVIRGLSVEDCASLPLSIRTIEKLNSCRGPEFTEEVIRRYADSRLAEELIISMFRLQKTPLGNTYEGDNIDKAARWLHILYRNGVCKEMIEKQNGKVIHKAVAPVKFDMSNPIDREWAIGYHDNSHPAIVFDAACENGQRYITDPAK